jgi:glycosyltransferase involved in cell wall biosynthesis
VSPKPKEVTLKSFVIVPCKNEALNIHSIVADYNSFENAESELWLVEGGSTDGTENVCARYASRFDNIHHLSQQGKGKFRAVRTVIEHLQSNNESGIVVIWDADHSIRYGSIHDILKNPLKIDTFVFTERIGSFIEKNAMPQINHIGNRVIAFFASIVFRSQIADALSGTKIFPLTMFTNLEPDLIQYLDLDTYGDLSYFLLAKKHGYHFEKMKVDYFARAYGASSLKRFSNGIELLKSLYKAFIILNKRIKV